ncbi:MAG: 4-alpha-glucanotransferase [Candidatus Methylomirabilales bacterium]
MTRGAGASIASLRQLARLYGVQATYVDVFHRRKSASPDALLLTLRALGAPVDSTRDVPAALRERRQALWRQGVEPVVVAWDGGPTAFELRLPVGHSSGSVACHLTPESGEIQTWTVDLASLSLRQAVDIEGERYLATRLPLPGPLPWGYHRLRLETRGGPFETMITSAPMRAYSPSEDCARKTWGVFLPLYALHSAHSWGGGDFTDLAALVEWVAGLGGSVVATLPLLAAFLDEPCDPSPYAPASRLFWNELYLDVTRIPELKRCPTAQALLASEEVQRELDALRSSSLIDYRRQMALKRTVLEELVRGFVAERTERHAAFQRFVEDHPQVADYARFRATGERQGTPWPSWPPPLRDGVLREGDYDETARHYHLYVQWVAHGQIHALAEKTKGVDVDVYLDLPLGVHPHSYDVWREREAFALDVSGGAPPDAVFTAGQDWGFPPLHPGAIRAQGYRYVIATLRHQLAHAGLLRIDHVMGLHRLFWIPKGLESREGVYVRYPAEELYAIVSLESHRYKASIVGENLGTVPAYVHSTMARHNLHRMHVLQYELATDTRRVFRGAPREAVASLNTHDMPPFAAYWRGLDIADRRRRGLVDRRGAALERKHRQTLKRALAGFLEGQGWLKADPANGHAALKACLRFLGAGPARVVLVNLEDLWLETQPQNVPATREECPNWQRKARHSLEALCTMSTVLDTLRDIEGLRRQGRSAR